MSVEPWQRSKDPARLPVPLTAQQLADLGPEQFTAVVRDHLVPRGAEPGDRTAWSALWRVLSQDNVLAERTFDVLERFLTDVEQALGSSTTEAAGLKRMRKFQRFCEDAWQRLQSGPDGSRDRAGRQVEQLVRAIEAHRAATLADGQVRQADHQLWLMLTTFELDPSAGSRTASGRRPVTD